MKKIRFAVIVVMAAFLAGCYPTKEEASRYPCVSIPTFTTADYYALLSRKDPEIVYNAVCNLMDDAIDMGETLSKKDADKTSVKYIEAKNVYMKIAALAGSRDPRIQAASLRFLQLFATRYKTKGGLIASAFLITPHSAQAAFEKIELLGRVAMKEWNPDLKVLKALLGDRSWLVSRAAYALVDKFENEEIRAELVKKYKKTDNLPERLLMLTAFQSKFSDKDFEFLSGELLTSPEKRIRQSIIALLPGGKNEDAVISWLEENYNRLRDEDMEYLVSSNLSGMAEGFSNRFFMALLLKGFVPKDDFYGQLYSYIRGYENSRKKTKEGEEALQGLKKLEEALRANSAADKGWETCRIRMDTESYVDPKLRNEFDQAVGRFRTESAGALSRFKTEAASIFTRYKVDKRTKESLLQLHDSDVKGCFPED